jgi:predicted nucleic acid-binding protein
VVRRYWDACAFLGWLREEQDKVEGCGKVIRAAEAGKLQIVTSALTLAEVLWVKGKNPVPESDRELVRDLFRNSWIVLYQLDRTIGEKAQEVVWKHGVKPKDSVHVATAMDAGVERLETFDGKLLSLSGIGQPSLTIAEPDMDGQMF